MEGREMTKESHRGTAYHEAGHAVVAWALGVRVAKVEIGPADRGYPGGTHTYPPEEALSLRDQLAILLGGKAAEFLFDAPTHGRAWFLDRYYADKLVAGRDGQRRRRDREERGQSVQAVNGRTVMTRAARSDMPPCSTLGKKDLRRSSRSPTGRRWPNIPKDRPSRPIPAAGRRAPSFRLADHQTEGLVRSQQPSIIILTTCDTGPKRAPASAASASAQLPPPRRRSSRALSSDRVRPVCSRVRRKRVESNNCRTP